MKTKELKALAKAMADHLDREVTIWEHRCAWIDHREDAKALREVSKHIRAGQLKLAVRAAFDLDEEVRAQIPEEIYDVLKSVNALVE